MIPWVIGALIFAGVFLLVWAFWSRNAFGPSTSGSSDWPLWNSSQNSFDSSSDNLRTSDDGCRTDDSGRDDSAGSDSGSCDSGSDSGSSDSGSSGGE